MNGYHDGLTCEHVYSLDGSTCGEPAEWITAGGTARCHQHFKEWLRWNTAPSDFAQSRKIT